MRRLLFCIAAAALGCVTTTDEGIGELSTADQALSSSGLISPGLLPPIVFWPSWRRRCLATEALPTRWFVRRAGDCSAVSGAGGVWVGTRVFEATSGVCSYSWRSLVGDGADYWALNSVATSAPKATPFSDQAILADCMPTPSACIGGGSACPTRSTITPPTGPRVIKTVNPCGACSVSWDYRVPVIIPDEWLWNWVTIDPWAGSLYSPAGAQAFYVAEAPGNTVPSGTLMTVSRY